MCCLYDVKAHLNVAMFIVFQENEEIYRVDLMVKDKKQNVITVSQALNKKS